MQKIIIYIAVLLIILTACNKDEVLTDPSVKLEFSTDSVLFDTVFTTVGSVTKYFKVYNRHNSPIEVSSIRVATGNNSFFTLNVDGVPGRSFEKIEIPANDSIFVFVKVTIDPTHQNNPLVITDSIVFLTNGNTQSVNLTAWGQDAYYHTPKDYIRGLPPLHILQGDETWKSDKPHLIYGYVVVDSLQTLTIEPGAKLHFHTSSGLWIYRGGRLLAKGTKDNPIVFQGDRLEWSYSEKPNQWDRIWINDGAADNEMDWCIIKNAFIGIQAEPLPFALSQSLCSNKLKISNTIIRNCGLAALLARNHQIDAYNLLAYNCGQHILALTFGGKYDFRHCTFANYWAYSTRKTSAVIINNYYEDADYNIYPFDLTQCYFGNCIIYGNYENEISVDKGGSGQCNYLFENCLVKISDNTDISDQNFWRNTIKNENPDFKDYTNRDYHLGSNSKARDIGKPDIAVSPIDKDLDNNLRTTDGKPDAGVYEFVP